MNNNEERRFVPGEVEIRSQGRTITLDGYAAVWGAEAQPLGTWTETVMHGAFKRSLNSGADIPVLYSHDPDRLLGRTRSGTARVSEDDSGLYYAVDLPNTTLGRDVAEMVERRDVTGSSFRFVPHKDGVNWSKDTKGRVVRELRSVTLLELGPTPFPAYEDTNIQLRSLALAPLAAQLGIHVEELIHAETSDELRNLIFPEAQTNHTEGFDVEAYIAKRLSFR